MYISVEKMSRRESRTSRIDFLLESLERRASETIRRVEKKENPCWWCPD